MTEQKDSYNNKCDENRRLMVIKQWLLEAEKAIRQAYIQIDELYKLNGKENDNIDGT